MCIPSKRVRKIKVKRKTQGCVGRPHRNTWGDGGDNIGFHKRVKRKKNLLNTNGRIHPEPHAESHSQTSEYQ